MVSVNVDAHCFSLNNLQLQQHSDTTSKGKSSAVSCHDDWELSSTALMSLITFTSWIISCALLVLDRFCRAICRMCWRSAHTASTTFFSADSGSSFRMFSGFVKAATCFQWTLLRLPSSTHWKHTGVSVVIAAYSVYLLKTEENLRVELCLRKWRARSNGLGNTLKTH